jgi:hypothetical protein
MTECFQNLLPLLLTLGKQAYFLFWANAYSLPKQQGTFKVSTRVHLDLTLKLYRSQQRLQQFC